MINVTAINENGSFEPKRIPENCFGSLFNGNEFIFFETEQELLEQKQQEQLNSSEPLND